MEKSELDREQIEKILKEFLRDEQNSEEVIFVERRKRLIIKCPVCRREGILILQKSSKSYRFSIEHWIVYKKSPNGLTSRQRNDRCTITLHEKSLFLELLEVYKKHFEIPEKAKKWLTFYGIDC